MSTSTTIRLCFALILCAARGAARTSAISGFDREAYEEEAGSGFSMFSNPKDDIHGFGYCAGTWLKNTPVLGEYLARLFYHGGEHAYYSGIGMTLRIMPRRIYAPFIGGGGNYNYSLARSSREIEINGRTVGDSYWSGHAETGIRVWFPRRSMYLEGAVRRTWNAGPEDYTLFFLSYGQGPVPGRSSR